MHLNRLCNAFAMLLVFFVSSYAAEPKQITKDGRWKLSPCYGVDGKDLYYSLSSDIGRVFLIKQDLATGKTSKMFEETTDHLYDASFSSDGKYLAYCQTSGSPQLFVVIRNLTEQTEATYRPVGARSTARRPRFIPGTTQLVFNESGEGGQQIAIVNVDGGNRRLVTELSAINRWPDVSPDGKKIVFCSSKEGNYDLFTVNTDGTGLTQLTDHPLRDIHPAWSPDGKRIAFVSVRDGDHEIFILDLGSRNVTQVTKNSFRDDFPAWSPDSKKLAFISQNNGATDIYELEIEPLD